MSDKEFRIILPKKFSELHKHTNRQGKEIRKTVHERSENFNAETETI